MNGIIEFIFKLIFPKAPGWISTLLTTAIPSVLSLVEAIDDAAEKTGAEKFEFVVFTQNFGCSVLVGMI